MNRIRTKGNIRLDEQHMEERRHIKKKILHSVDILRATRERGHLGGVLVGILTEHNN